VIIQGSAISEPTVIGSALIVKDRPSYRDAHECCIDTSIDRPSIACALQGKTRIDPYGTVVR